MSFSISAHSAIKNVFTNDHTMSRTLIMSFHYTHFRRQSPMELRCKSSSSTTSNLFNASQFSRDSHKHFSCYQTPRTLFCRLSNKRITQKAFYYHAIQFMSFPNPYCPHFRQPTITGQPRRRVCVLLLGRREARKLVITYVRLKPAPNQTWQ